MDNNTTYILDDSLLVATKVRFFNYVLDIIFTILIIFIIGIFIAFFANVFAWHELLFRMSNMSDFEGQIVFIIIRIFYYTITEGFLGSSFGKMITGTVVVDETGFKPSLLVVFKRTLCRIIPFDGFSFLGDRGWHDSISDTYVVNKKDLEADMKMFYELKLIGVQES